MAQTQRSTGGPSERLTIIRQVLAQALHLQDKGASLTVDTSLLGTMPEIDSIAVVTIIAALEEHFDIFIGDTEFGAENMESVGALLSFVDQKCGDAVSVASTSGVQAEFLQLPSGSLFALHYLPALPRRNTVIVLCPPFAEELNKSRRQISMQARRFCEAGYAVLVFDLFGTGDSEGAFADASISLWKENYRDVLRWLNTQGYGSCILWGVRFGALFIDDLLHSKLMPVQQVLLWQPELSGEQAIRQFLRLQVAANMLSEKKGMTMAQLEEQLNQGSGVEVAGYGISPALYTQAKNLKLANASMDRQCPMSWLHVLSAPQTNAPERIHTLLKRWQSAGLNIRFSVIDGSNYWSSADLVVVPGLVDSSVTALIESNNGFKEQQNAS